MIRDWLWKIFRRRSWRPRRTYSHGVTVLGHCDGVFSIAGWLMDRPVVGDALRLQMASGNVALCRFVDVKWNYDPEDMFTGTARFVEYEIHPLRPGSPGTEQETEDQKFERMFAEAWRSATRRSS